MAGGTPRICALAPGGVAAPARRRLLPRRHRPAQGAQPRPPPRPAVRLVGLQALRPRAGRGKGSSSPSVDGHESDGGGEVSSSPAPARAPGPAPLPLRPPHPLAGHGEAGEEGKEVPAVRRGRDAAVEVGADGAGHALQRLRGPPQGGRGAAGAGAPAPTGDGEDGRPAAPGEPCVGLVARRPDLGARFSSRRVPAEEEAAEAGEASTGLEDGASIGTGAGAGAGGVPDEEEKEEASEGVEEEAVAAPEVIQALPALRLVVDAAVEGGADGPQHAVQRVRRAL